MHGPIDYIIVGFEGNKFDGSILKALSDALDDEVIGLVALSFITKDAKGEVAALDIADAGDGYVMDFVEKYLPKDQDKTVDKDDVEEMAELLENNTSAGLLVIEQKWAIPLKKALIKANGVLVAEGRIHPDADAELNKDEED